MSPDTNKKIKIGVLTTISKTMDWFIVDSMRNLAANGYDVTLISNMEEGFAERNSDYARCIHLPMSRGASVGDLIKSTRALKKIFKQEKFDVLYYTSPNASMYAAVAGRSAGVKIRVYSQCGIRYVSFGGLKRFIFKTVEKLTCRASTHIRAQSPKNMQFAIDEGLCPADKISVVGIGGTIGVELDKCRAFDHAAKKSELRSKYGIPEDAFVYGYVGRVNADKGINELIEAFRTVSAEQADAYLVLVGMLDDANPITPENLACAQANERIVLTGNVPASEVYHHMAMFDLLTHPTYREGFGKVLQEAMGVGIPILTTNVPGPSEVVEDGVSGILCEARSPQDLAEKMVALYGDADLRDRLSAAGLNRAETYFDRPIMLRNILEDMNGIIKESKGE